MLSSWFLIPLWVVYHSICNLSVLRPKNTWTWNQVFPYGKVYSFKITVWVHLVSTNQLQRVQILKKNSTILKRFGSFLFFPYGKTRPADHFFFDQVYAAGTILASIRDACPREKVSVKKAHLISTLIGPYADTKDPYAYGQRKFPVSIRMLCDKHVCCMTSAHRHPVSGIPFLYRTLFFLYRTLFRFAIIVFIQ